MKKTILLTTILLCGIGFSQKPKGGDISFSSSYNEKIKVRFNDEVIATIEGVASNIFTYSLKNGQLTVAVGVINNMLNERYTIMYTIDMESKMVKKKERLNTLYTYKDHDLELSVIGDRYDNNAAIMQYTWKGKMNEVILPDGKNYGFMSKSYISENGSLVACSPYGLDVFSMGKKKFTHLGEFGDSKSSCSSDFCFPLNEYVIYFPCQNSANPKVYLYRYAEEELYATRYLLNTDKINDTIDIIMSNMKRENMSSELSDIFTKIQRLERYKIENTIISNMRNGNIYEQFLPLTRVENIDSMVNANSWEAWRESIKKVIESSDSKKK